MARKILHITSSLDRNGTETFIMNVYRHLDRDKVQFDFLLFTQSTDGYYEEAQSYGAQIYRLTARRKRLLKYVLGLYAFFKEHASEYDGIHFSGCSLTTILPVYFACKYGIRVRIVHAHNSSCKGVHNRVLHRINKLMIPFIATDFLACSECASHWFYVPSLRKRCLIVNNGISTEQFQYDPEIRGQYRRMLGWENQFVIGHIGRFVKEKNHAFLIHLFKRVIGNMPNARLALVGDGELKDAMQGTVIAEGLSGHVDFLGIRADVNRLLQAFDCFVLPSFFEGLPFVLIEAQCSGLKVFASTNVSEEARVTDNISFLQLGDMDSWVGEIVECQGYKRTNVNEDIIRHGYSIADTVNALVKIYQK